MIEIDCFHIKSFVSNGIVKKVCFVLCYIYQYKQRAAKTRKTELATSNGLIKHKVTEVTYIY